MLALFLVNVESQHTPLTPMNKHIERGDYRIFSIALELKFHGARLIELGKPWVR